MTSLDQDEVLLKEVARLKNIYDEAEQVIDVTVAPQGFTLFDMQQDSEKLAYTGFESLERFLAFVKFVQTGYDSYKKRQAPQGRPLNLSMEDHLLLVLARLRVGLLEQDLGYRFGVHVSTVVKEYMPECFTGVYPSTRVILDCTEVFTETPSDFTVQSDIYSSYKCHNTTKGLLGITPNVFVSFVSDLAPGRVSDKTMIANSGLCALLKPGDSVMADKGFVISEEVEAVGAILNIPPFLGGKPQLSLEDEARMGAIAKVRIPVEWVIGQMKSFRILRGTFPNSMSRSLEDLRVALQLYTGATFEP
ncbi:uncharacterized protein LOC121837071 [Ixodes scapularis]|uniref:uncharacterized protein LOC121837071 n=1 Tax=Ixodes scapularis TaxID=6945 RepID=UPI001C385716|nr:uncharacterized protein LOC121837071 [Ixodes scapularis]